MWFVKALTCLLMTSLLVPEAVFGGHFDDVVASPAERDKQLQESFLKFPLVSAGTPSGGVSNFQIIDLTKSVNIDGIRFYGFRFKVPKRTAQEDFVWAGILPTKFCNWYIVPETGDMTGFDDFFHEPRISYDDLDQLLPVRGSELVLQHLPGDRLEDGRSYVVWFAFRSHKPGRMSLAFTFARIAPHKAVTRSALEQAVGLHRKQIRSP